MFSSQYRGVLSQRRQIQGEQHRPEELFSRLLEYKINARNTFVYIFPLKEKVLNIATKTQCRFRYILLHGASAGNSIKILLIFWSVIRDFNPL